MINNFQYLWSKYLLKKNNPILGIIVKIELIIINDEVDNHIYIQ